MPLTQQHRTNIHKKLSPIIGEEETNALLDTHPSPNEDTVTKDFLRAEIADMRNHTDNSIADLRTHTDKSIGDLRTHTDKSIGDLRTHTDNSIGDLRTDMVQRFGKLEKHLERSLRKHTLALIPILIAALAIVSRIT